MSQEKQAAAVDDDATGVAVEEPAAPSKQAKREKKPAKRPPEQLPPYKVLLHNDDVNEFDYVINTVRKIAALAKEEAILRVLEAHKTGVSLLLVTHKERAELIQEQCTSASLTVTIEPDE